jgi:hypothetical protein
MTRHVISLFPGGFLCSCGERTETAERASAVASRHQLAALVRDAMNGSGPLVTNCLACNAESQLPTTTDDAIAAYADWVGAPCPSCGKKPIDVAGASR